MSRLQKYCQSFSEGQALPLFKKKVWCWQVFLWSPCCLWRLLSISTREACYQEGSEAAAHGWWYRQPHNCNAKGTALDQIWTFSLLGRSEFLVQRHAPQSGILSKAQGLVWSIRRLQSACANCISAPFLLCSAALLVDCQMKRSAGWLYSFGRFVRYWVSFWTDKGLCSNGMVLQIQLEIKEYMHTWVAWFKVVVVVAVLEMVVVDYVIALWPNCCLACFQCHLKDLNRKSSFLRW